MVELTFRNRGKVSNTVFQYLDMRDIKHFRYINYFQFYGKGDGPILFYIDSTKFCRLSNGIVNELTGFFSLDKHDAIYILFMWVLERYNISVRDYSIGIY